MAGTKLGGQRCAATNIAKYGDDFYRNIGAIGGKRGNTGGFASNKVGKDGLTGRQRASVVGTHGGRVSKRGKTDAE
jgi:hypothetical protein